MVNIDTSQSLLPCFVYVGDCLIRIGDCLIPIGDCLIRIGDCLIPIGIQVNRSLYVPRV